MHAWSQLQLFSQWEANTKCTWFDSYSVDRSPDDVKMETFPLQGLNYDFNLNSIFVLVLKHKTQC